MKNSIVYLSKMWKVIPSRLQSERVRLLKLSELALIFHHRMKPVKISTCLESVFLCLCSPFTLGILIFNILDFQFKEQRNQGYKATVRSVMEQRPLRLHRGF